MRLLRAFWPAPVVAGLLMAASFPPLDLGFLMPLAWAVLLASMRVRRGAKAGRQAFVAALLLFLPGLSWIEPLVWPFWLFVAAWCAGFEALFGWGAGRVLSRGEEPPRAWVLVLPATHLLTDMLRTVVMSGFPWMLPGYSGWRNPVLLGSADLLGVHGATFALLVLAACLAEVASQAAAARVFAARALLPAGLVWGALGVWMLAKPSPEESPGPTFLLLQPSLSQRLKEDAIREGAAQPSSAEFWSSQESLAAKGLEEARGSKRRVDVVVWAETMVPQPAIRPLTPGSPFIGVELRKSREAHADPRVSRRVAEAAAGAQTLAGIETVEGVEVRDGRVFRAPEVESVVKFNTVVLLDPQGGIVGHQDKQHLTPGGEYIPLVGLLPQSLRRSLEEYLQQMAGFLPELRPGESCNVLPLAAGGRAGVMICYESLFPEIPRGMVRDGATLLVNCSNYGWFAGTSQMDQALAICALRAAELRRTFVLSSNNGISAVIGPDGRVRAATRADVRSHLLAETTLCSSISPFAALGEAGAWAVGTLGAALCALLSRRKSANAPA